MFHLKKFLLMLVLAVFLFGSYVLAQEGDEYRETFDNPELSGWELAPGVTIADGVMRIPSPDFAFKSGSVDNSAISVKARFVGQGELIVGYRASDAGMYQVVIGPDYVLLIRDQAGEQTELLVQPGNVQMSEWLPIEISLRNAEHRIIINGTEFSPIPDPQLLPPGGIFLHARGGGTAEIDELMIAGNQTTTVPENDTPPENSASNAIDFIWVRTGGPPGGLGYDIRYNFDNPDIWYATDNFAGVHMSTDNGQTWFPSNNGVPRQSGSTGDGLPVFCLTVDPHNPQIIWIGTDITGHIYKSTDAGQTWVEKDNGVTIDYDTLTFRGFTVDPRSSDIVYAMGETSRLGSGTDAGIGGVVYKTTNGGENWTKIWDGGMPSSLTRYMWINPQNPDILYVSTGIFDRAAVGEAPDFGTNPDPFGGLGVLKSTDGGLTWHFLNEDNGLEHLYIGSLYMHPGDPDILLAAAGHVVPEMAGQRFAAEGHSPLGIYRTTDGGETWTQVLEPPPERSFEVFSSVELCPSDPDIGYAGSEVAVYRTEDAGVTWTLVSGGTAWGPPGVRAGWPIDMQCDPRDTNRVFANNYSGGNFLSEDGGRTWRNASNGYTGAQIINLVVDPFDAAHIYEVGRSGAWESNDGGTTWHGLRNLPAEFPFAGGEWGGAGADPSRPNHVILGSEQLLELTDDGWRAFGMPFPFGPMASTIVFAPADPTVVYVAAAEHNCMVHHTNCPPSNGLAISRDNGETWQDLSGGQLSGQGITDLAVDPFDASIVYVAAETGVFKSTDYGANWQRFSGLPEGQGRTIAVSPIDSLFLLTSIHERGFFISHDGGVSWQQISSGLEPNGSHHKVVFDPSNPHIIYTTDTFSGVYRSIDGGLTWLQINGGLDSRAVTGLAISADGQHLYVGTNGAGVYRLDVNGVPPQIAD